MAYLNRKKSPEIELWNVSLLPIVRSSGQAPPQGPAPLGGKSLQAPALLSVTEGAATIAEAA